MFLAIELHNHYLVVVCLRVHGTVYSWASEGGTLAPPWFLKLLAKKVVFFNFEGKNQISPLLAFPWKNFWENPY